MVSWYRGAARFARVCTSLAAVMASLALAASFPREAAAQSMRFIPYEPCGGGNSRFCANRILLKGEIERDTAEKLRAFMSSKTAADSYVSKDYHPFIVFDSLGGDIAGAIELGRFIRANRLDTILESTITDVTRDDTSPDGAKWTPISKQPICASACSLAFLGGVSRVVGEGSRFGVHQFSGAKRDVGESASQVIVTQVAMYVQEMGVDRRLIDLASATPSSKMYWVDEDLLRALQVDNTRPKLSAWTIDADTQGKPSLTVIQGLPSNRKLGLAVKLDGGMAIIDVVAIFDKRSIGASRLGRYPIGEMPEIQFSAESGLELDAEPVASWREVPSGQAGQVVYASRVKVPAKHLATMAKAKKLSITDGFGTALSDVTIATDLSSENLTSGMSLLLRAR